MGDPDRGEALLRLWATAMRAQNLAESTIHSRPRAVRQAAREVGMAAHELTTEAIEAWVAEHERPATRATYYRALRAWHLWLVRAGHREDDPMARTVPPRVPRTQPRPITTAQLDRVLALPMRASTRAMVLLAAYQGLRVHEIAKLRGEDIDLDDGTLYVLGKGGAEAILPLHPVVADIASAMPRRGWWFPSPTASRRHIHSISVTTAIGNVMRAAGVGATAHQLRHWYATELLRGGADVRIVQTLMRHASLSSTAIYTRVDEDQQRRAMRGLPVIVEAVA